MKGKSKVVLAGAILGAIYAVYIISYFFNASTTGSSSEQLGGAIATALVTPHMVFVILAVIFNWLGFFIKKPGFILTAAILYCVAGVIFIPYLIFVIPMLILGFVGYAKQKEINQV